ncbi:alpha/beta fold hydrolase [Haematobacter genomosp. 1]|uniref:Esterase n=1 Tax=Haematobacter genomosp. 1 TaxID=366618 RepID=A0A212A6G3_9RHOB|nr:alpha/beta fold hydrolase [Haematobacter genomosp. 1]OWJ74569.1 esterase [Haematobacter genomosp. 1]
MTRFVLVHGACHGAWCWRAVEAALRRRGHETQAIDLPCRGEDHTPAREATLAGFAERVARAMERPSVLVGHSFAGFPITAAAALVPDRIEQLVYVAAYVPAPGRSLRDMRKAWPDQPLRGSYVMAEDGAAFTFRTEMAGPLFYHDCAPEIAADAAARLCPEPVAPQETPIPDTDAATALPRRYILCTEDRAIPPTFQAAMVHDWSETVVMRLATSHSPFLSKPHALAELLCYEM